MSCFPQRLAVLGTHEEPEMRKTLILFCLVFLASHAFADVSDTAWKAVTHKMVTVEKNDGSTVSGELSAFDSNQVVVITSDGTPVVVDRTDVKSVKVQTASGGQTAASGESAAPAEEAAPAAAPAATATGTAAPGPKRRLVVNFNPIGNIISSFIIRGVDITADVQYALSKSIALGAEPEIALGGMSGFGVWGGVLWFPLATAPEGLFVKAYAGLGMFGGHAVFELMAACGWQFLWGGFVFSPEIGFQYVGLFGFHWRLNIGFAI
jgi:hypothetical protein